MNNLKQKIYRNFTRFNILCLARFLNSVSFSQNLIKIYYGKILNKRHILNEIFIELLQFYELLHPFAGLRAPEIYLKK